MYRCPSCGGHALGVDDVGVCCGECDDSFPILEGVLNLHPDPTAGSLGEMAGHRHIRESWLESVVPEALHGLVTGEAAEALYLGLPRVPYPELVAAVPAFARLDEIADDYFELLDWLDVRPGQRVLEFGAHNGWSAQHFAKRGAEVVATDISQDLAAGSLYFVDGVYFERVYADMLVCPFADGAFDLIFMAATAHHTGDLAALYGHFHRLLKPGGRAVLFSEPLAGRWDRAIKETFGAEEKEWGAQEHIYTISEYLGPARRAGFRTRVIPQTSLLREDGRKWAFVRSMALGLHGMGLTELGLCSRWLFPLMLQFYPRIPFPRFAMVLEKGG